MQAKYDARNPAALKQLVAGGTKLLRFPKDMMDAAFKEAMALYSELVGQQPGVEEDLRRLLRLPRATRTCGSASPKAAFDEFMQSQKL